MRIHKKIPLNSVNLLEIYWDSLLFDLLKI